MNFLYPLTECTNTHPSSCDKSITPSCEGARSCGYCKKLWKDIPGCRSNTPGKVEDDCHIECGTCSSFFLGKKEKVSGKKGFSC